MPSQKLQLLLVEDSIEDQQMIRDALLEIEEYGPQFNWFKADVVAVDYLCDAIHCLERARFDAVLLDLQLPDSPLVFNTFTQVQLASPGTPVVGLMESGDEGLAYRLLREGAQDVLVKREIECAPLARSLRYAIERQRRSRALRAISFFDDLTGFYSRYGFIALAGHDIAAARVTTAPLTMAILEIAGLPKDLDTRDLLLLDIAEILQNVFVDATLIGRLDTASFGLAIFGQSERDFLERLERFGNALRPLREGLRVLGATLTPPDSTPCDLEQLFSEARPKPLRKAAMLAD